MLDRAVKDLALAWLDSLASLALGTVRASASKTWDGHPQLVEVCVEILTIAPFHGCVWDALSLATAVAGLTWYVFVVILVAGLQSGACEAGSLGWELV